MSYSQTQSKAKAGYDAGVQDYKLKYYTPDYTPRDTDLLAAFRFVPQPGVPPEEGVRRPVVSLLGAEGGRRGPVVDGSGPLPVWGELGHHHGQRV